MASGIDINVEWPELQAVKRAFEDLPRSLAAKYMGAALNKSIDPGLKLLRTLTPRGPTGNLRRAIAKKVKRYSGGPKSKNPAKSPGAAVALAGFTAPPRGKTRDQLGKSQKGGHGGFLEFGTKERRTKGYIASSFSRSGAVRASVGKRSGKVTTKPKPPKGFVKAVPKGETVSLGRFPIGGSTGVPPVKTAYERALPQMRSLLNSTMVDALNKAVSEQMRPFPVKSSKTS